MDTGEMTGVDYPGTDTPDVTFSYTRLGQKYQITDGVGTRTFNYDDGGAQGEGRTLHLIDEGIAGANGFCSRTISRDYQGTGTGEVPGRDAGFHIGSELDPEYHVSYSYNDTTAIPGLGGLLTGRLDRITGTGLPAYGVLYQYELSSDLIAYTYFDTVGDELSAPAIIGRSYEENRDLVYRVTNLLDQGELSRYTYVNDALGRRKGVTTDGGAFGSQTFTSWGYDAKSQLESSRRYTGAYPPGTEIPDQMRLYEYDQIGNRKQSTTGTAAAQFYCATDLNQYSATDDADTCTSPFTESFAYDEDGNLTLDRQFVYTWDAENRLILVETRIEWGQNSSTYDVDDKRVYFAYDYMGRRVRKRVETYNGSSWPETSDELFIYDGWNPVLVFNGNATDVNATAAITRKYTWGLDLSRTLHGAGGIGGLLAAVETKGTATWTDDERYWFMYDANGNVGQVLNATDPDDITLAAHYEYDPYGNVINDLGSYPYATANPFRFSTKWFDNETGLGYWGYRYYSPRLGRWISRDPIGEKGGLNLLAFVRNRVCDRYDMLGLVSRGKCCNGAEYCQKKYPEWWFWQEQEYADCLAAESDCAEEGGPEPCSVALDVISLHCYVPGIESQGSGVGSGLFHCDISCADGADRSLLVGGGTGPTSSGGNDGPGGNPSWREKSSASGRISGSTSAPQGTCKCIRRCGQKMNGIPYKVYDMPPELDGNISNSNALASTLLRCCNVSIQPTGLLSVPGWGHSVERRLLCPWPPGGISQPPWNWDTRTTKVRCDDLR